MSNDLKRGELAAQSFNPESKIEVISCVNPEKYIAVEPTYYEEFIAQSSSTNNLQLDNAWDPTAG